MIARILAQLFGTENDRQIKQLMHYVEKINKLESTVSKLTDDQFPLETNRLKQEIQNGRRLDDVLPEAYALVREIAKRRLGQRHYDVQLMGGIALHQGKIAEMKTGEGKTLTATLPLYLNALTGKSVHLVTVNDYLARRDASWMAPIYEGLGLTVASLQHSMSDQQRKEVYNADILYGTNNELGFDYLRDNMKFRLQDYVQRDLYYAIVDEVDSILIDEARTPLIISGSSDESSQLYIETNRIISKLIRNTDYEVDEKMRNAQLTESGIDKVESSFHLNNLYAIEHINILHHVHQALRAHALFKRDREYVVYDDQVLIVDEFTGRILQGRRYSDGLHQALEAKEGVTIERESQTLASITLQNYFRLYNKLAGMTGTAKTEAEEFYNIYKLDVVTIPSNRTMIREDKTDLIFLSQQSKFKAIVNDIKERYQKRQPVLIGTVAVETSELLSNELDKHNIPHEVLNAKKNAREAEIIEQAGQAGQITIATNMAGRGTDIKLSDEAKALGGLYILGTERHESRRIDNQLRGRSGRQGDPGESRFYISLDDDMIRVFSGDRIKKTMERLGSYGMQDDEVIESNMVMRSIERAQEQVERNNFEQRKHRLEYDDVLNQQRNVIYQYRRDILEGEDRITDLIRDFITKHTQSIMEQVLPGRTITNEGLNHIFNQWQEITGIPANDLRSKGISTTNTDNFVKDLINVLVEQYFLYRGAYSEKIAPQAEKWLMLEVVDNAWKQHMLNLDHLEEGIGLRGWGQKTPLTEYKREAFYMFKDMLDQIRQEVLHHIFHMNLTQFNAHDLELKREQELKQLHMTSGKAEDEDTVQQNKTQNTPETRVGRNDPCPCKSGKKYKKCCGA